MLGGVKIIGDFEYEKCISFNRMLDWNLYCGSCAAHFTIEAISAYYIKLSDDYETFCTELFKGSE